MFRKHYRLISGILIIAIAVAWIVFLETGNSGPAPDVPAADLVAEAADKLKQQAEQAEKAKQAAALTSTPEPTEIPQVTPPEEIPTETPTAAPTPTPPDEYTRFDYVVANVEDSMNIRSGAGSNYKVIGKLAANSYAKIIERGAEWFKIKSGTITGYVSSTYILTDNECIERMRELGALKIKITGREVNIRAEDNTNCEIVESAKAGDLYEYLPEYSTESFYAVKVNDRICYVATSLSEVNIKLKTASGV